MPTNRKRVVPLTVVLRDKLADGQWHSEDELVVAAEPLVDAELSLRFFARHKYALSQPNLSLDEQIAIGRRGYIQAVLQRGKHRLDIRRFWKVGAFQGGARNLNLQAGVLTLLLDGQWHPLSELLSAVVVRPEVAMRRFQVRERLGRPGDQNLMSMGARLQRGREVYMQHTLSRIKKRKADTHTLESRGKYGKREYRLVEKNV